MNFGFGQPQQQGFPMGQQQMQPQMNFAEQQKKQNQTIQMDHVKMVLSKIYELQNQPQFQGLIQLLKTQQKIANDQITKTMDQSDIKAVNPNQIQDLYRRGQRIKEKNIILVNKLLLVKAKLERLMYQNSNPHSKYEYETSMAMDKIRTLKSEITQKCTYLKTLKFNKSNEKRNQPKESGLSNFETSLSELKNGTEVLEREVLRQKTEMEVLVKYVNESN